MKNKFPRPRPNSPNSPNSKERMFRPISSTISSGMMRSLTLLAFLFISPLESPIASANSELDRRYGLETVGFIRAIDNVDGAFADYIAAAYQDYFARQS